MNSSATASQAYYDFASLARLEGQAVAGGQQALKESAQQFEALFIQMMLKSMRDATIKSDLFSSSQLDTYNDMYDQQIALHLSQSGSFGIADMLQRQLGGQNAHTNVESQSSVGTGQSLPLDGKSLPSVYAGKMQVLTQQHQVPRLESRLAMNKSLFDSPESFVHDLMPLAQKAATTLGIDPKFILAQAALETGWGNAVIHKANGTPSYNLFGIKADQRWMGDRVAKETLEHEDGITVRKIQNFRVYENLEQGMQDYVRFLSQSPRYAEVLESGDNAAEFVQAMQASGYATDPDYGHKLSHLFKHDAMSMIQSQ
jgi:peptidoglycan hydrolase FlgJ